MGKISKMLGVPQPMECPHCREEMAAKRSAKAKIWVGLGAAASISLIPIPAAAAGVAAATVVEYVYDRRGVVYRCECGFRYSEKLVDQALEKSRASRRRSEQAEN